MAVWQDTSRARKNPTATWYAASLEDAHMQFHLCTEPSTRAAHDAHGSSHTRISAMLPLLLSISLPCQAFLFFVPGEMSSRWFGASVQGGRSGPTVAEREGVGQPAATVESREHHGRRAGMEKERKKYIPYTTQQMIAPSALRTEARGCRGGELGRAGEADERGRRAASRAAQRRSGGGEREAGGRHRVYASSRSVRERGRPAWGDRGAGGRVIRKDGCETFSTPSDPVLDAPAVVKRADRERGEREVRGGRSRRAKAEITGQQRPADVGGVSR
jgi:hypothetical protein